LSLSLKPIGSEAQLAAQAFAVMTYKPSKLGQTDLVFGLWSEFISMPVHVESQVSMVICATMVNTNTHRLTGTDRQLLTGYAISSAS